MLVHDILENITSLDFSGKLDCCIYAWRHNIWKKGTFQAYRMDISGHRFIRKIMVNKNLPAWHETLPEFACKRKNTMQVCACNAEKFLQDSMENHLCKTFWTLHTVRKIAVALSWLYNHYTTVKAKFNLQLTRRCNESFFKVMIWGILVLTLEHFFCIFFLNLVLFCPRNSRNLSFSLFSPIFKYMFILKEKSVKRIIYHHYRKLIAHSLWSFNGTFSMICTTSFKMRLPTV